MPWAIEVSSVADLYVAALRDELRSNAGFSWTNWNAAAQWAIGAERAAEALEWAQAAVALPFIGQENFATLSTLSQAQTLAGQAEEGEATLLRRRGRMQPMLKKLLVTILCVASLGGGGL